MKNKFLKLSFYIVITGLIASCGSVNSVVSDNLIQKRKYTKGFYIEKNNRIGIDVSKQSGIISNADNSLIDNDRVEENNLAVVNDEITNTFVLDDKRTEETSTADNLVPNSDEDCGDIITMRNGEEIQAKILEVGLSEIKYKKCSNLEGPTYTVLKSEVFMVKYMNGEKEVFKEEVVNTTTVENPPAKVVNTGKEIEYFSIVAMIDGVVGLFLGLFIDSLLGLLLGLFGILLGAISLHRVKNNPEKYSEISRTLAIIGLVCGILVFLAFAALVIILLL